jgi:hypothetical protein
VFSPADIDAAIQEYDIVKYGPGQYPLLQGTMGIDPGWGVSSFGIVVTHFVDGLIRVAYAEFFLRLMAWLCLRNNDYRNRQTNSYC